MVSLALAAGEPLSVTRTTIEFVLGPCASVGVHVKTPDPGLMTAPVGAPGSSEYVKVCAGTSASDALAVNVRSDPSTIVLLPMGASTGVLLVSVTVIVMVSNA